MPVPSYHRGRIQLVHLIVGAVAFTAMLLVLASTGIFE